MAVKLMPIHNDRFRQWQVMVFISLFIFLIPLSVLAKDTLLVVRPQGRQFEQVTQGLREETSTEFDLQEIQMTSLFSAESLSARIIAVRPKALILMDNQVISLYKSALINDTRLSLPSISCMGVNLPDALSGLRNAVGISYEVPIVTSIVGLRAILRKPIRKVGILHRELMSGSILEASDFCAQENIKLVSKSLPNTLNDPEQLIKDALWDLFRKDSVDALWIPNDNVLVNPKTIASSWSPIIQKTHKPAVVGVEVLVNPALDMGFFAELPDLFALGNQVADLVSRAQENEWQFDSLFVEPPVSVRKFVNIYQAENYFGLSRAGLQGVDTLLERPKAESNIVIAQAKSETMGDLSLKSLLDMQVTSVSKKAERMMDVPTSIYVLTREDIQRSGATRLVDILNLVPGFWSTDLTYNWPNATIRNFDEFTSKVNLLIDGVPLISPIIEDVMYQGLYLPLNIIERVEVIKGSNGVIYGANATTGVINIITQNPKQMQGLLAQAETGSNGYLSPMVRYGGKIGNHTDYSAYFSYRRTGGYYRNSDFMGDSVYAEDTSGSFKRIKNHYNDDEEGSSYSWMAGMRSTTEFSNQCRLSLNGWYQQNRMKQFGSLDIPYSDTFSMDYNIANPPDSLWLENLKYDNAIVSARLDIPFNTDHQLFFNSYIYDYLNLSYPATGAGVVEPLFSIMDFEAQDTKLFGKDKSVPLQLISGANWRTVFFNIREKSGAIRIFDEPKNSEYMMAAFVQGKMTFAENLDLVLGSKAEAWTLISETPDKAWKARRSIWDFVKNYPYYSPNARLAYRIGQNATAWAAWSQSVTVPAYIHTNLEQRRLQIPPAWVFNQPENITHVREQLGLDPNSAAPPAAGKWVAVVSSNDLRPTVYNSTEAGFRVSLLSNLALDICGYYSLIDGTLQDKMYDVTWQTIIPSRLYPGDSVVPIYLGNMGKERTMGAEVVVKWNPRSDLRTVFSYDYNQSKKLTPENISDANRSLTGLPIMPHHVFRNRLYFDFPYQFFLTINSTLYSSADNAFPFSYVDNKYNQEGVGLSKEINYPSLRLDCIVQKQFMDGKLSAYVWGRNLLRSEAIEAYYWFIEEYPHTINRTFGAGVKYQF